VRVVGLDHVVLAVSDVERSVQWYCDLLDLSTERVDEWRSGSAPFVSLRIDATTVIDLFVAPADNEDSATRAAVDHVALVVTDVDLNELAARPDLEVEMGPARLWGAQGWGEGLYLLDPDGNRIELRTYED
jgi:catechol 2,3-dioxygenase-like lactoylglutathione lyase family enzyme